MTSVNLSGRVKVLANAMLQSPSSDTGADLVFLVRSEKVPFRLTAPVVWKLLELPSGDSSSSPNSIFLRCFEIISLGVEMSKSPILRSFSVETIVAHFPLLGARVTNVVNFVCDPENNHAEEVPGIAPIVAELVAALLEVGTYSTIFLNQETAVNASFTRSIARLMIFSSLAHVDISFRPFLDVLTMISDSTNMKAHPTHLEFRDHPRANVSYALSFSLAQILAQQRLDLGYTLKFFVMTTFATIIPKSSVVYGAGELFPLLIKLLARLSSRRAKLMDYSNRPIAETLPNVITLTLDEIYAQLRGGYPPIKTSMQHRLHEIMLIASKRLRELHWDKLVHDEYYDAPHDIFKMIFERQMPHVFYPSVLKLFRAGRERLGDEAAESLILPPRPPFLQQWMVLGSSASNQWHFYTQFCQAAFAECANEQCPRIGSVSESSSKLRCCSACMHTAYCSSTCQKRDWQTRHRTYCHEIVETRGRGRLYSFHIPRLDEEFWLWMAVRDLRDHYDTVVQLLSLTDTEDTQDLVLTFDYQYSTLPSREEYQPTYLPEIPDDSHVTVDWVEGCSKHWNDWADETPWPLFCTMVRQMTMDGEHPVLLVAPIVDDRTLKFLTSTERLTRRRYLEKAEFPAEEPLKISGRNGTGGSWTSPRFHTWLFLIGTWFLPTYLSRITAQYY
ncbi:hypothetical protein BDZ89DRAFT_1159493 [Hymenopellis radicata]|nr:hypothetical protein BDZ89DRAFT_1159493 [Hymenopellis radicata]